MTDQTTFDIIFKSFIDKFPPALSLKDATLKLSTQEIIDMIEDFWPGAVWPEGGLTWYLISKGYKYEPIEINERVRYFWLLENK